jgi:hypothetical protein
MAVSGVPDFRLKTKSSEYLPDLALVSRIRKDDNVGAPINQECGRYDLLSSPGDISALPLSIDVHNEADAAVVAKRIQKTDALAAGTPGSDAALSALE